jgi:deoxyhypusine synthase
MKKHSKGNRKGRINVAGKQLDGNQTLPEIFESCLPAFGGRFLRNFWRILKRAVGEGCPIVLAVAGPVTVSDQHRVWLNKLLELGYVSILSTTDAICYHDFHDIVSSGKPYFEINLYGSDIEYRKENIVRVTDIGFKEEVLFKTDRLLSEILLKSAFQRPLTNPEFRYLLGKELECYEKKAGVRPGLLSTAAKMEVPVFCGAPADGSIFLEAVKLKMLSETGKIPPFNFSIDMPGDVIEFSAYHYYGLLRSEAKKMAIIALGGGVPKNYALQPEPFLSQALFLDKISGYHYDIQIVSAPVTEGSLSSCWPAEAHTWGKVDETYPVNSTSVSADYTMLIPFLVQALLQEKERLEVILKKQFKGNFSRFKEANPYEWGFLKKPLRLFARRDEFISELYEATKKNAKRLLKTLKYSKN